MALPRGEALPPRVRADHDKGSAAAPWTVADRESTANVALSRLLRPPATSRGQLLRACCPNQAAPS